MFCWSLFVLLYFFFWPLCCLFFFDIRNLFTTLVASNSSCEGRIWWLKTITLKTKKVITDLTSINHNSNMKSFFRFVHKRAIYRLGMISLAHAPLHVTDISVVNVHVDELLSARIWQHKLCATLSANVNINYCLPIKVYYRICTFRHIRIELIHGSQNVLWVLTLVGGY